MTRWWAIALLFLSVGLNLGLVVAVLQQRFRSGGAPPAAHGEVVPAAAPHAEVEGGAESAGGPEPAIEAGVATAAPGSAPGGPPLVDPGPVVRPTSQPLAAPRPPPPPGPGSDRLRDDSPPPQDEGDDGLAAADGPPQARLEELATRLGVPPAARPQFIALQRRFVVQTRDERRRLELTRRELKTELAAGRPDRTRIAGLLDESARLQARLERSLVDHVLAARELLDGEAERRYLDFLARLGPRGAGGPGGPGGSGDDAWGQGGRRDGRPGARGQRRGGWPPLDQRLGPMEAPPAASPPPRP